MLVLTFLSTIITAAAASPISIDIDNNGRWVLYVHVTDVTTTSNSPVCCLQMAMVRIATDWVACGFCDTGHCTAVIICATVEQLAYLVDLTVD